MKRKNDGDWFALSGDYPLHRKTLRLKRILGCATADAYPVRLMAWLRSQESVDGAFTDDGEVEQVAGWSGEVGKLVEALREAGFLDGLTFHNWCRKGGAGVASMLAERARWAERHPEEKPESPANSAGGSVEAPTKAAGGSTPNSNSDRDSDSYRDSKTETDNESDSVAQPEAAPASAPSARTIPPKARQTERGTDPLGFEAFWAAWPSHKRKVARTQCTARWRSINPDPDTQAAILNHVAACRDSWDWRKNDGEYIPAPLVYLNQRRWEAEPPSASPPAAESPRSPRQSAEDEMRSVLWGKED